MSEDVHGEKDLVEKCKVKEGIHATWYHVFDQSRPPVYMYTERLVGFDLITKNTKERQQVSRDYLH